MLIASHEEHRREERKAVANIKANSKYFFSYAKNKLKNRSTVGPLVKENGVVTGNPEEMTEILKDQYDSVFSIPSIEKKYT